MWVKCSDQLPKCGQRVLIRDQKAVFSAVFLNAVGYREESCYYNPLSMRLRWNKDVKQLFLPDTSDREVLWVDEVIDWMEMPDGE